MCQTPHTAGVHEHIPVSYTHLHKTCTLTESGVKKAEAWFNVENLADADNMTLRHYIDGDVYKRQV